MLGHRGARRRFYRDVELLVASCTLTLFSVRMNHHN